MHVYAPMQRRCVRLGTGSSGAMLLLVCKVCAHVVCGLADASWEPALLALAALASYGAASSSAAW
jgi:hypothetical protein